MSFVKKIKSILFEEEDIAEEDVIEEKEDIEGAEEKEKEENLVEEKKEIKSERDLFKVDNNFHFPDFDEDEFQSSISRNKPVNSTPNVLEYERKKTYEKRTDYGRYERIETREYTEKKKFKPSPIISPVYGILNQDYKAEDIVNKNNSASNIDIDSVRKKAFESKKEEINAVEKEVATIDEPVVTFFEEKDTVTIKTDAKKEEYKSIDDLLESAAEEISLEDTLEIPKSNNLDAIEEELEKLEVESPETEKELDDTLDNDLFELIDSMYDDREDE